MSSPRRSDPSAPPGTSRAGRGARWRLGDFVAEEKALCAYRRAIVRWFRRSARALPWRKEPTPYRVWVSEVMLQQTRVETVLPYFERFLARFPNVSALARASLEDVREAWSGLGYYRRARLLHQAARIVCEHHGGRFPAGEADALALPGVGRYTAGAVLSIALGLRAPVLEANVRRVLARVFAIRGEITRAPAQGVLWEIARQAVSRGNPGEINQAQMELGALVCRAREPECPNCPLRRICRARREGLVSELPELPRPRRTVRVSRTVLLVRRGEEVLLRRRRENELLPGMWDFPGAFTGGEAPGRGGPRWVEGLLPFRVRLGRELGVVRHSITHRRIELRVREAFACRAPRGERARGADGAELCWCRREDALAKALSSPARRILCAWAGGALDSAASSPVSCEPTPAS